MYRHDLRILFTPQTVNNHDTVLRELKDLLKYTPSTHPDSLPLQLALTELETLAERLNNRKAADEDAADLRSLLENSNLKLPAHTKDGRVRKLVKQGNFCNNLL